MLGDEVVVAAAMIDRLVHRAEVISLEGDRYRLRNRNLGWAPLRHSGLPDTVTSPGIRSRTDLVAGVLGHLSASLSGPRTSQTPSESRWAPERRPVGSPC